MCLTKQYSYIGQVEMWMGKGIFLSRHRNNLHFPLHQYTQTKDFCIQTREDVTKCQWTNKWIVN